MKSRTTNDADIHLVDLRTGVVRNITAHTGEVKNAPADFSPDGRTLLFISDAGSEFKSLRSYELESADGGRLPAAMGRD